MHKDNFVVLHHVIQVNVWTYWGLIKLRKTDDLNIEIIILCYRDEFEIIQHKSNIQ